MSEQELWEKYQDYRMRQHNARNKCSKESNYWRGRADGLLVMARALGYETSFQPEVG